jgi:NADP-dependent 3-hydroxy acid dehydrogenase YdfG
VKYCEDKVAVVTGAGGTLCGPIAVHLAKKGAKVVLIGRTASKLETTAAEISAAGGTCRICAADVTDEPALQAIAAEVAAGWGPCRFLVNGAGATSRRPWPIASFSTRWN